MLIAKGEKKNVEYKKIIIIDNIRNVDHLKFEIPNSGVHVITG